MESDFASGAQFHIIIRTRINGQMENNDSGNNTIRHVSNYERILDIDNCPSIKQLQFHLRFCFSKAEHSNKSINSFFFQQQQHSSYFEILGISFQICSNQNEMDEKRKNQSGRKREKIRKGVEWRFLERGNLLRSIRKRRM